MNRSVSQPVSQSVCQSVSQSVSQSVGRSVGRLVGQSVSQSFSQSVKDWIKITDEKRFARFEISVPFFVCVETKTLPAIRHLTFVGNVPSNFGSFEFLSNDRYPYDDKFT